MVKILNFGSKNFDYVYKVQNIVKTGETIDSEEKEIFFGGKGLNQSLALAKAGLKVIHAGTVGEDGRPLIELCEANGIDTSNIRIISGNTGHTIIQVDKRAQNSIILLQNEINEVAYIIEKAYEKKILKNMEERYPKCKIALTVGKEGAYYSDKEDTYYQNAFKVDAIDTTAVSKKGATSSIPLADEAKKALKCYSGEL